MDNEAPVGLRFRSIFPPRAQRIDGRAYAASALVVGAAALTHGLVIFPPCATFLPYILAVLVAAGLFGLGPGLSATALALVAGALLLDVPVLRAPLALEEGSLPLGLLTLTGVLGSALTGSARRAPRRAPGHFSRSAKSRTDALRTSQALCDRVLEGALCGLYIFDAAKFRHLYVNAEYRRLTGYTTSALDALGRSGFVNLFHDEDRAALCAHIEAVSSLPDGEALEIEYRLRAADGRWIYCLARHAVLRRDLQGRARELVGIFLDVTERARAADTMRTSEAKLRRMVDGAYAFVGELALDGTLTEANLAPLVVSRLSRSDVLGQKFWDCPWWTYDPRVQHRLRSAFERAARGEMVRYDETVRTTGEGRMVIDLMLRPVIEGGRVVAVVPSWVDVTARHHAEEETRRRAEELEQLMELIPIPVWVARDPACAWVTGNRAAKALNQAEEEENLSAGPVDAEDLAGPRRFFTADGRALSARELPMQRAAARNEEIRDEELILERKDGTRRALLGSAIPLRDAAGKVRGSLAAFVDLTERKRAEEALRGSEERFRVLAEASPSIAFCFDAEGRDGYANSRWQDYFRISFEEAGRRGWEGTIHPDDLGRVVEQWNACVDRGVPFETEYRLPRWDGEIRWHIARAIPIQDTEGRVTGWCGTVTDVHDIKVAQTALAEQESLLRAIMEAAPDPVFAKDRAGRMLLANTATLRAFGRAPSEVLGHTDSEWHAHIHEAEAMSANDRRVLDSETTLVFEESLTTAQGVRIFSSSKAPLRDAGGRMVGLVGVSRDVTAQRWAEASLYDRTMRLRLALEGGRMGMWDLDLEADRLESDHRHRALWGLDPEAACTRWSALCALIHPDDRARVNEALQAAFETAEGRFKAEFRLRPRQGTPSGSSPEERWLVSAGIRLEGSEGPRLIGVAYDVTDEKGTVERLRRREWLLQMLADNSPDIITRFDRDLRHVFVNPAVERATGLPPAAFLGKTNRELGMPEALCQRWDATIEAVFAEGKPTTIEFWFESPGGPRFFDARFVPERGPDGQVLYALGVARDRTEEKVAADALREAEERFQLALEKAPVILFNQDRDLRYTWLHNPLEPFDAGAAIGHTDPELLGPEEAEALTQLKTRVIRSGQGARAEVAVSCGGALKHFDLTVEPIREREREGREGRAEREGREDHREEERGREQGEARGIACAAIDITRLKHAEAELREADRRKDEFLATLAHELRNPLAPIRTGLELLELAADDPAATARIRGTMERQLGHVVRLIDDLTDISRIRRGKIQLRRERLDLRSVVHASVEAVRPLVHARQHMLPIRMPHEPVFVWGDPNRLAQVISNLLTNAARYTPEGGHIELSAEQERGDVVLEVTDNGVGLSQDQWDHVFEMFAQVSKEQHAGAKGLGIGLALAKNLVEMHGGTIAVKSEGIGTGCTFTIRLPASSPASETPAATEDELSVPLGRRVLVVDDNLDAAESLAELLKLTGQDVRTAYDGPGALEAADAFRPELVFLDIGLPGMSGLEVATNLRQRRFEGAQPYIVAITGWGTEADRRKAREAGFDLHLTKPIGLSALKDVLGRLGADRRAAGPP